MGDDVEPYLPPPGTHAVWTWYDCTTGRGLAPLRARMAWHSRTIRRPEGSTPQQLPVRGASRLRQLPVV